MTTKKATAKRAFTNAYLMRVIAKHGSDAIKLIEPDESAKVFTGEGLMRYGPKRAYPHTYEEIGRERFYLAELCILAPSGHYEPLILYEETNVSKNVDTISIQSYCEASAIRELYNQKYRKLKTGTAHSVPEYEHSLKPASYEKKLADSSVKRPGIIIHDADRLSCHFPESGGLCKFGVERYPGADSDLRPMGKAKMRDVNRKLITAEQFWALTQYDQYPTKTLPCGERVIVKPIKPRVAIRIDLSKIYINALTTECSPIWWIDLESVRILPTPKDSFMTFAQAGLARNVDSPAHEFAQNKYLMHTLMDIMRGRDKPLLLQSTLDDVADKPTTSSLVEQCDAYDAYEARNASYRACVSCEFKPLVDARV